MFKTSAHFAHQLSRKELLAKILRVDHIGELAALRIYDGQKVIISNQHPCRPLIEGMQAQEKEHLDVMERLCAKHNIQPTVLAPWLSIAAYALGIGTAFCGKETAMACTTAVEELIGEHYNQQLMELLDDDPVDHADLLKILTKLRDDELHHYNIGVENDGLKAPRYDMLKWIIQSGCKGAIWLAERI
ncbi:5-demethoxyubiquinone hydroxylase [Dirofilaria immitis]|nr:5-demethoxyubiquinone hydroxylase, mitochondrial [Dirofilaria immitis]